MKCSGGLKNVEGTCEKKKRADDHKTFKEGAKVGKLASPSNKQINP